MKSRILGVLLVILAFPLIARAAPEDGESMLTPNQQRRITQINNDLPYDLLNHPGDSKSVHKLRKQLRKSYASYRHAVQQHGNGTPQSKAAGHDVMISQEALHQ